MLYRCDDDDDDDACVFVCLCVCVWVELFYTERAHVRNLKVMQQLLYKPMRDDQAIPDSFVTLLFPNIDEMIELHGESICTAPVHAFICRLWSY